MGGDEMSGGGFARCGGLPQRDVAAVVGLNVFV